MKEKFNNIKTFIKNLDKKRKILLITLCLVIIAILGVTIYILVTDKKEEKEEKIVIVDNYYYKDGYLFLLDVNNKNKEIGKYECENKDPKLCYVSYFDTDSVLNNIKRVDEKNDPINFRTGIYSIDSEKYVFINDNTIEEEPNIVLYDINNKKTLGSYISIIDPAYEESNLNRIIAIDKNNKYGLLDLSNIKEKSDEIKIEFDYDYLGIMDYSNTLSARKNGYNFILDIDSGKVLSKNFTDEIKNYNSKYVVTSKDNIYNIYDLNNKVIAEGMDFIGLSDSYYFFVKNNKIYLKSYENALVYPIGIDINSTDYVETLVYDGDLKLTSDNYVIKRQDETDELSLFIKEKDTDISYTLNMSDSSYSKDKKYTYYDGKLYFYSDDAKENVIGTYSCKNINDTTKGSIYCLPYLDILPDNGTLFSKYTIIKDIQNESSSSIKFYLYNLSTNKLLGSYKDIKTTISKSEYDNAHVLHLIAVNKSDKAGVLKVDDTSISKIISYDNINIYYIDNNFIAEKNSKYYWYDVDGKQIISDGFTYISFYDNYVVTVNDKELLLYDHAGKKLINTSVVLPNSVKLFDTTTLPFNVDMDSNYYIINIGDKTKKYLKTTGEEFIEAVTPSVGE